MIDSKVQEVFSEYVNAAVTYGAKFEVDAYAERGGVSMFVYTRNRDNNWERKVWVSVYLNSDTNRVNVEAQWLTGFARFKNERINKTDIVEHIKIASEEAASTYV